MSNTGQSDQMNVDTKQPSMPKMKTLTSSGSTGSGTTMMDNPALHDRLVLLHSMQQRKSRKKNSFDATQSLNRTTSNANRDRYYSLATKQDAKKINQLKQEQRQHIKQMKNRRMKKYIQSKKNIFEGVEDNDEKKDMAEEDSDDDGDAAMILKDKKLAKVDDDGDTEINANPLTPKDTEMKESDISTSSSSASSVSSSNASSYSTTSSGKDQEMKKNETAKSQDKKGKWKPMETPIPNPSVGSMHMISKTPDESKESDTKYKKRSSGFFDKIKLFKNKSKGTGTNDDGDNDTTVIQPQRLKYQLPNSKGEKFELYTWLKPTKLLGEGAYAAVCEVIDQRTNKKYAIKKNRDVFSNVADARRILREIKLMIHLDHPHVMSLCGVIPPEPHDRDTYRDCYLIMPKMDTTLSKVIRSRQKLSERHIQYFIYQIARGLEYMHSGGIIHRDLKPENILVNATDCKVKITDFGLSRGVRTDVDTPQKLTEYVVTRWYRAPEVMCCSRLYDYQIDTWALGCISAELYTRKPVFKGRNHIEQLQLIFHFRGTPKDLSWITTADAKKWIAGMPAKVPQDLNKVLPNSSKLAQEFISQLLIINPHKRPTISNAIKHPWMKEFAREKDYRKCPVFNISFEFEASIKTAFGVRHMMYEELHNFHKLCTKKETVRMERYQNMKRQQQEKQKQKQQK